MTRYMGITDSDREHMMKEVGLKTIKDLFADVNEKVYLDRKLNIPPALSEMEVIKKMKSMAEKNSDLDHFTCFLGAGAYDHYIPAAISQLLSRQEFYTAYTPYQPEISQGTLQAIFEYQSMICELSGMDVSNASLYDGATALTEAAMMAAVTSKRSEILISENVHPESRQVLKTYAGFRGITVKEVSSIDGQIDLDDLRNKINDNTAAFLMQSPNFYGIIEDIALAGEISHGHKSLLIVSADPISMALLKNPGELGADVVVGEGQGLGNAISYGGPYLGFLQQKKSI